MFFRTFALFAVLLIAACADWDRLPKANTAADGSYSLLKVCEAFLKNEVTDASTSETLDALFQITATTDCAQLETALAALTELDFSFLDSGVPLDLVLLGSQKQIKKLTLSHTPVTSLEALAPLENLESLDISETAVNASIAPLQLPKLNAKSLNHARMTVPDGKSLVRYREFLNLVKNNRADDETTVIAFVAQGAFLKELRLPTEAKARAAQLEAALKKKLTEKDVPLGTFLPTGEPSLFFDDAMQAYLAIPRGYTLDVSNVKTGTRDELFSELAKQWSRDENQNSWDDKIGSQDARLVWVKIEPKEEVRVGDNRGAAITTSQAKPEPKAGPMPTPMPEPTPEPNPEIPTEEIE